MRSGELMEKLRLKDRMHFRMDYLQPALAAELIQMTIPDKPRSSKQKYRDGQGTRSLARADGRQRIKQNQQRQPFGGSKP